MLTLNRLNAIESLATDAVGYNVAIGALSGHTIRVYDIADGDIMAVIDALREANELPQGTPFVFPFRNGLAFDME